MGFLFFSCLPFTSYICFFIHDFFSLLLFSYSSSSTSGGFEIRNRLHQLTTQYQYGLILRSLSPFLDPRWRYYTRRHPETSSLRPPMQPKPSTTAYSLQAPCVIVAGLPGAATCFRYSAPHPWISITSPSNVTSTDTVRPGPESSARAKGTKYHVPLAWQQGWFAGF